jgi:hypothetical protein
VEAYHDFIIGVSLLHDGTSNCSSSTGIKHSDNEEDAVGVVQRKLVNRAML